MSTMAMVSTTMVPATALIAPSTSAATASAIALLRPCTTGGNCP
jgi:hypothetical protein